MRVLIADDEFLIVIQLRCELEALGHEVVGTAGNGRQAMELCESLRPDLVLMDVQMPEMDGLTATRNLMAAHPVCIVILTAQAHRAGAAEEAGAMGYTQKPLIAAAVPSLFKTARRRFDHFLARRKTAPRYEESLEMD